MQKYQESLMYSSIQAQMVILQVQILNWQGDNVIKQEITVEADKETVEDGVFKINLGKINDQDTPAGKLVFHNVTLVKVNNEEN